MLTRGKEMAKDTLKTDMAQTIYILFPERRWLAGKMASPQPLTSDQMWDALQDLHSLCVQDSNVLYLPGSRPIDDSCPVEACRRYMSR